MTETMCVSGVVKYRAGKNVSTAITGEQYTEYINQAESLINAEIRDDYTAGYAALPAARKKIFDMACSAHAAGSAINFDPSTYTFLGEANFMVNVNLELYDMAIKRLRLKEVVPDYTG